MRILIVLTSHDRLGDTGKKTGFWFDEFATPYYIFKDAGIVLTLASPEGGLPPVDPRSEWPEAETAATIRFQRDGYAQAELANTRMLSSISARDHDAAFYPGGHGPLWDLANDPHSIALIETMFCTGRPLALVCHGPGALRYTMASNGRPLVAGKSVTGFSNLEEAAIELTDVVPFLVEDMLRNNGGNYSRKEKWQPYAVSDGDLITGQNPASSEAVAKALLDRLRIKAKPERWQRRGSERLSSTAGLARMRRRPIGQIKQDLVDVAAAPSATGQRYPQNNRSHGCDL